MKRIILLLLIMLPSIAMANIDGFSDLVKKYSSQKGFTTIELSKDMLQSMGVSNGIYYMEVIAVEELKHIEEFRCDVESITSDMKVVMAVNSGNETVKIYCRTNDNGQVCEMVIYTTSGDEGVVIRLTGNNIQLKEATNLINF